MNEPWLVSGCCGLTTPHVHTDDNVFVYIWRRIKTRPKPVTK
jgi:hypothetical protein